MVLSLLKPSPLAAAARRVAQGPYVAGAVTERPWLRLVMFFAVSALVMFGLMLVAGGVMGAIGAATGITFDPTLVDPTRFQGEWTLNEEIQLLIVLGGVLALLAAGVLTAACLVYGRSPNAFLWPDQRNGVGLFAVGFLAMMLITIVQWPFYGLLIELGPIPLFSVATTLPDQIAYVAAATGGLLVAAAAEEVVFRGVALRILGGFTQKVWLILLSSAVIFSAFHLDPDPVAFVARAASGAVWAWAALRLGGLAFAIGAHLANNLFIALFLEPMSTAAMPDGQLPAVLLIYEIVTVVLVLLLVEILARRRSAAPRTAAVDSP